MVDLAGRRPAYALHCLQFNASPLVVRWPGFLTGTQDRISPALGITAAAQCPRDRWYTRSRGATLRRVVPPIGATTLEPLPAIPWVTSYNENRPHQGRWCYGKTPMQTFLDTTPLAREKIMAA
jgi:hypothetical protein